MIVKVPTNEPIMALEMFVESAADVLIADVEMASEMRVGATNPVTGLPSEVSTTMFSMTEGVITGMRDIRSTIVDAVPIDIVRTGIASRESGPEVPIGIKMSRLCQDDIPGPSGGNEYTTSINSTAITRPEMKELTTVAFPGQVSTVPNSNVGGNTVAMCGDVVAIADVARPLAVEGWGRDAMMVEAIFRIIEGMEPPWVTLNVLENAVVQLPHVNRDLLRHTIMTILMSQRRCVVRITRAGLRLGPRTDQEGNAFVELDLDYSDRYSNSH